ncbi:MAG: helix-turn-helix domain-containing protein [Pseudonocardiaceae bacterium]
MGQRPNELTPHESLHHYWGAELRALRVGQGLSLAELGHLLHCDPSYLAKIERAERPIPATLAESCDRMLQTQGMLIRLHTLAESDRDLALKPSNQTPDHVVSDVAHVASPPGSLTGGATFPAAPDTGPDTNEEIVVPARTSDGRVVFVSVPRRVVLQSLSSATVGLATIPAATSAHRATLPADVNPVEHFQQMLRVLVDHDRLFGARRVIPVVHEQINVIQQLRSSWRGTDHQQLVHVQAQYAEFCGWLHEDAGEYHLAESWTDRALGLSHIATDHDLTVFILVRTAGLAGAMRVSADAIGAGEQALRMAPPRSRIAAYAATWAGRGYALGGDHTAAERTYERARELLLGSDADPDSMCGPWLNETSIDLNRAWSLAILGDYQTAAQSFQNAMVDLPGERRSDRGVYLARAALVYAGDHQVEHAATLGLETLTIGVDTRSGRILTELSQLNDALAPWNTLPAVLDFRTAMKDTVPHQA